MNNRIVYSDDGVLQDYSPQLNSYDSNSVNITIAVDDFIYIGARLPFNHIFLKISGSNQNSSKLKSEYWDGNIWRECVEIIDETNGLKKSGHIQFTPNRRHSWAFESTNEDGSRIEGLTDIVIYDLYWMRLSLDVASSQIGLRWVGNLFCNDDDIYSEFPDLEKLNVKDAFKLGKQDWESQRVRASEIIIDDLINKNAILEKGQILDWRLFKTACVSKTAELIYQSFGNDFTDLRESTRNEYLNRMKKKFYRADQNLNAIEDKHDQLFKAGFLTR